jgi:hypothetical protein
VNKGARYITDWTYLHIGKDAFSNVNDATKRKSAVDFLLGDALLGSIRK